MAKYSTALVKYDDVDFLWISGHWDVHLSGLCRYKGRVCRFETDKDEERWGKGIMVAIYKLTIAEKTKWLFRKKMFEWCIGYHWTYPHRKDGVRFGGRRPKWFWGIVFSVYYKFKSMGK